MSPKDTAGRFMAIGETTLADGERFYEEEVQLALRNSGLPLEGLR